MACGTTSAQFGQVTSYFYDSYTLLSQWCQIVQKSNTCCAGSGNNACTVNQGLNGGSYSVNQDTLGYGNSCTYVVGTGCGYPQLNFTGTNIDVVLSYNKTLWTNSSLYNAVYQTWDFSNNVEVQGNFSSWTLKQNEKADTVNQTTNQTVCTPTSIFVTLTNLNNAPPMVMTPQAFEARSLQAATPNITTFTYAANPTGEQSPMSAYMLLTTLVSAVLMISAFAF